MKTAQEQFDELSFYTLSHPDMVYFIHQHAVDVFQAQQATKASKPIGIVFSLIGLYLYLEEGYTGRQIQQAHMRLAQSKSDIPPIELPKERGSITVSDVLKAEPGQSRDVMIRAWCASVWEAYTSAHQVIIDYTQSKLGAL